MVKYILIFIFLVFIDEIESRKSWYYTDAFQYNTLSSNFFSGSKFNLNDLFSNENSDDCSCQINETVTNDESRYNWSVYSGQTLIKLISHNCTIHAKETAFIESSVLKDISKRHTSICSAVYYDLGIGVDYGANSHDLRALAVEIGLYDHNVGQFELKSWLNMTIGRLTAITINEISDENSSNVIKHQIILTADPRYNKLALIMHTWISSLPSESVSKHNIHQLKLSTYNIWHNNPPSWKYHNPYERWELYEKRMLHWANTVVKEDPDIILLQEVRIDNTFTPTDYRNRKNKSFQFLESDYGSQLDHVLLFLNAARKDLMEVNGDFTEISLPYYHCVYHPGMLQFDRASPQFNVRIEEGLAILSKYPITNVDVLLLSRDLIDSKDDHQRIVLKATVLFQTFPIEILNTHSSLSIRARSRFTEEILNNGKELPSRIQLFGGDFNAEISEDSMMSLIKNSKDCLDISYHSSTGKVPSDSRKDVANSTDSLPLETYNENSFLDIWCLHHQQYNADALSGDDLNMQELQKGFTFPVNNPSKRIDFLLVRQLNFSNEDLVENFIKDDNSIEVITKVCNKISFKVIDCYIYGKQALNDNRKLNIHDDIAMADIDYDGNTIDLQKTQTVAIPDLLDKNGPVWPSDHFALMAVLEIFVNSDF